MDQPLVIKCSRSFDELSFSDQEGLRGQIGSEHFVIAILANDLSASLRVYSPDPHESIVDFFDDLAANWKGWKERKKWSSLEGELILECSMDSLGHVEMLVTLNSDISGEGWKVQNPFYLDAGQLGQISFNVRKFFAM